MKNGMQARDKRIDYTKKIGKCREPQCLILKTQIFSTNVVSQLVRNKDVRYDKHRMTDKTVILPTHGFALPDQCYYRACSVVFMRQ